MQAFSGDHSVLWTAPGAASGPSPEVVFAVALSLAFSSFVHAFVKLYFIGHWSLKSMEGLRLSLGCCLKTAHSVFEKVNPALNKIKLSSRQSSSLVLYIIIPHLRWFRMLDKM